MARQTQKFVIDGDAYTVKQLTTSVGIPLAHRVVKVFGPAIRDFVKGMPKGGVSEFARSLMAGTVEDEKLVELGVVALTAFENCPTPLLTELGVVFSENTTIKSGNLELPLSAGDIYEEHFAGRPLTWLKWVMACARFNWAGFFSSSTRSAQATAASETTTPSA
jgi:hypothetical protein